jgi:integrase
MDYISGGKDMALYKQPGCKNWFFKIRSKDGKVMRRTTETDDRANAEIIEQTFRLAVQGRSTPSKLYAMLDAVCGKKVESTSVSQILPLYSEWLTTSGRAIGKRTLDNRSGSVRRLTKWLSDHYPAADTLENIDRTAAAAFANHLAAQGTRAKTRKNIIDDLSTVWAALSRTRTELDNPWPIVRPQVNDSERGKPFTREQEAEVLKAALAAGNGWHLACMLARYTGLRYSSVARLTWQEIDLVEGIIRHIPSKTKRHGITVIVPLATPLASELKAARAADPSGTHVLPLHEQAYDYRRSKTGPGLFASILTAAKLSDEYTFHSWRHTFRTRLSEAGVSDDLAKRLGGWTEDATAARYDHAERVEELRAAVEKAK